MKATPARTTRLAYIAVLIAIGIAVTACTVTPAVSPPTVAPSTAANPSLAQLPAGTSAYELTVVATGDSLRLALIEPAPVGSLQQLEVRIEQPGSWVSAIVEVLVERSSADGSSDTLTITGLEFSASDQALADGLQSNEGVSLRTTRGPNRMVDEYGPVLNRGGTAIEAISVSRESFWLAQLLRAPISLAGPIPAEPVGRGAVWEVSFLADTGTQTTELSTLTRLDLDRYVIEGRPVGESVDSGNRPSSVLLEGQVGRILPDRQEVVIGDLTITVTTVS